MTSSMTASNYISHNTCRLSSDFNILRQSQVFAGIQHDVVKLFAYLSTRRFFKAGDYINEQGKKANQAFLLVKGTVDITVNHQGKEIVLQQLNVGSLFGELALLAEFEWFFNGRASHEVEAIVIDRTVFQKVIEKFPDQKDKLVEQVIQTRIKSLKNQTTFMLDLLFSEGWKPTEVTI